MFCTQCGQKVGDYDRFCFRCGAALQPASVSLPPQPIEATKVVPPVPRASKYYGIPVKRKLIPADLESIQGKLGQLQDSAVLLNTTVKPDVFFKRLNFTLDLLLDLQRYEHHKIFTNLPSKDLQKILDNLEATVDNFIDRAIAANDQKLMTLKTEKARAKNREDFATKLIAAFDCANTFWLGNRVSPHYTGPLFTPSNYLRVQIFYDSLESFYAE